MNENTKEEGKRIKIFNLYIFILRSRSNENYGYNGGNNYNRGH